MTLLLKPEEAAKELRIGRTTMWDLITRGEVVSVKVGGSRRVPYDELAAYIKRLVAEQSGAESATGGLMDVPPDKNTGGPPTKRDRPPRSAPRQEHRTAFRCQGNTRRSARGRPGRVPGVWRVGRGCRAPERAGPGRRSARAFGGPVASAWASGMAGRG